METQRKSESSTPTPRHGWDISEWCALYGFSRGFYYKLAKQGKAPAVILIGGIRLITADADAAWRAQRGSETA